MFKQVLLVMFLIAQSSIIFAAIPDISGTYIETKIWEKICTDGNSYSGDGSTSKAIIYHTAGSTTFTSECNTTTTDEGGTVTQIDACQGLGSIDDNGNINGNYTATTEKPLKAYSNERTGTFSGTYNFTNWILSKTFDGNNIEYKNGIQYRTCTVTGSKTLTRITNPTSTTLVQTITGTSLSITPTDADVLVTSGAIPDIGALLILENSSATIVQPDGSTMDINQKAVVTLNPESISVVRGEVTSTVDCNYEVHTALATITSCPTTKKGADSAKFSTNYSQSGLGDTSTVDDTLTVSVEVGSVDIVDRSGTAFTVTAGNEKTITGRVPRTQWVLPIDADKLYGGENNFLIWTQFPDAASYQMEFNLPNPLFAEQNSSIPQFIKQVVPLPSGSYAEFEGLALLTLPLPKGADGLVLELRIFALGAAGNIIGESVSSDSTKVTLTD